jgi:levansucrase
VGASSHTASDVAAWTAAQVASIRLGPGHVAPSIGAADFTRISPELDVWDAWPVQDIAGNPAPVGDGETLWMALAAPHREDPDERHGLARIYLFERRTDEWIPLGPAFPDGFTPGSREWSGSAVLDGDGRSLTTYFTATGVRGEPALSFRQRLFSARATLQASGGRWRLADWHDLTEIVSPDPAWYMPSDAGTGSVGTIKAFRDPAYFHDAATGTHWIFFAASLAGSVSAFNGAIGAAVATDREAREWALQRPLISADTVNNELERPHVVKHKGLYYLFWSTQSHVFNAAECAGPTGLYGMVSDRLEQGWQPLNGSGLVFSNPAEAASQAYSWLVLPDLSVISFVDNWGQASDVVPRRFGGSFAPALQLSLDGATAGLAG